MINIHNNFGIIADAKDFFDAEKKLHEKTFEYRNRIMQLEGIAAKDIYVLSRLTDSDVGFECSASYYFLPYYREKSIADLQEMLSELQEELDDLEEELEDLEGGYEEHDDDFDSEDEYNEHRKDMEFDIAILETDIDVVEQIIKEKQGIPVDI